MCVCVLICTHINYYSYAPVSQHGFFKSTLHTMDFHIDNLPAAKNLPTSQA